MGITLLKKRSQPDCRYRCIFSEHRVALGKGVEDRVAGIRYISHLPPTSSLAPIASTAGTRRSPGAGSGGGDYTRPTVRKRGCSTETFRNSRQALTIGKLAATSSARSRSLVVDSACVDAPSQCQPEPSKAPGERKLPRASAASFNL